MGVCRQHTQAPLYNCWDRDRRHLRELSDWAVHPPPEHRGHVHCCWQRGSPCGDLSQRWNWEENIFAQRPPLRSPGPNSTLGLEIHPSPLPPHRNRARQARRDAWGARASRPGDSTPLSRVSGRKCGRSAAFAVRPAPAGLCTGSGPCVLGEASFRSPELGARPGTVHDHRVETPCRASRWGGASPVS